MTGIEELKAPLVELQAGLVLLGQRMRAGNVAEVEHLLSTLLPAYPDSADLHELHAVHLLKLGSVDEVRSAVDMACRCAPTSAVLHCRLGRLMHAAGDLVKAATLFERAAGLAPDNAESYQLLGLTELARQRHRHALRALRHAHRLGAEDVRMLVTLTDLEFDHGEPVVSLPVMRRLAELQPNDVDAQLKLGVILGRLFDHHAAVAHYRSALARLPRSADLHMALAQSLEYIGERESSAQAYAKAAQLRRGWALPIAGLLELSRKSADQALVEEAEQLFAQQQLDDSERSILGYALGKYYDAMGLYDAAWCSWTDANQARGRVVGPFDPSAVRTLVRRSMDCFPVGVGTEAAPLKAEELDEQLIFIVGMPRSGTTLAEQVIASHPYAHGCGELLDMTLMANHADDSPADAWPETAKSLDEKTLSEMRHSYLASARRHAAAGSRVLVDKAPLNFFFLGLVEKLFPNARVVWCRRDPRDVAVSNYGENFSLDAPFATSLAGIAEYQQAEERLMIHWQQALNLPIWELRYEEMVTDTAACSRRLVEFTGLPWDEDCLQFHQANTVVQTPSRWQVRSPVHTRSVGRWRNYAKWLEAAGEVAV